MTPKEILNEVKNVLTSAKEVELSNEVVDVDVKAEEVKAEEVVELAVEDEVKEEVKEEVAVAEEAPKEEMYVTKAELSSQIAELKAVINQLSEIINPSEEKDVPTELSKEEVAEVELAEEPAEAIVHSPEVEVEKKEVNLYAQNKRKGTKDRVFAKLFS